MKAAAIAVCAALLWACGGSVGPGGEGDAGELADVVGDVADAGARDARPDVDQVVDAGVDAPAALCCQVNQNIEVCAPGAAWQCDFVATHPSLCTDTGCQAGDPCHDDFGVGTVVDCGSP